MTAHRINPADSLRTYSAQELEHIAEGYHKKSGNDFYIPVDIELLLELEGIDLDIWPGLQANHKLLGMILINPETKKFMVYIDANLADYSAQRNRYRMTVAEELAHFLLHKEAIQFVCHPDDFRYLQSHAKWYECERNAKRLAAAPLMPASYLIEDARKEYPKIINALPSQYQYSNPSAVKNTLVSNLAKKYEVSFQSMQIRLDEWPVRVLQKIDDAMNSQLTFLE